LRETERQTDGVGSEKLKVLRPELCSEQRNEAELEVRVDEAAV
jgi:hypothetical protein